MKKKVNRILISAFGSGSGKTTFTMGLLRLLQKKGLKVSSYKCGPDYIDTMFHTKALNIPARNIDLFLSSENTVKNILSDTEDIAVIEGVMGFYDGIAFTSDASAYNISMVTDTPVIIIVDAKGKSATLKALISGMLNYKKNNIKGIILNRVTKSSYPVYKNMIESELNVQVLGYIPEMADCTLKSRHLGLITADEMADIENIIEKIACQLEISIDLDNLLKIAENTPDLEYDKQEINLIGKCRIGVAKDNAFCFYYADNLKVLEKMGAEIIYFSPLSDKELPKNLDGLIFYGGYPELYAEQLSANKSFISSLQKAYNNKIPLIAECGGFMYISQSIDNFEMASLIKGSCKMTTKLQNFGYVNVFANKDSMLLKKGENVPAHEFHYSIIDEDYNDCIMRKPKSSRSWQGVYLLDHVYAGYPHLYFLSNLKLAERFIIKAIHYNRAL
ncbi:MAG: cobyrinate a,c-diamide synthase [Mucispirillum sp.]|nr:cobyrinate a,c-diamide synthase [Mucispirillum sp.]